MVSITGIIINVVLLILIILVAIAGISFNKSLSDCESNQSLHCYQIVCPCDDGNAGPCFGYAVKDGPRPGEFYCSSAPFTLVNQQGIPI